MRAPRRIPAERECLHLAAAAADPSRIVELIDNEGLDPNSADEIGRTPLHVVCGLEPLHAWGADEEKECDDACVACVRVLVDRGADPNRLDDLGYAPIHSVHGMYRPACFRALVDAGADADLPDPEGMEVLVHYRPLDRSGDRGTSFFDHV